MKRCIFTLILASFLSMVLSVALSADTLKKSHKKTHASKGEVACSCNGAVGTVCATLERCEEMDGICKGSC
jgi:hypothetical protein